MKKTILIASALMISSTAFAATSYDTTKIHLDGVQSEEKAYEMGFAELAEYQAMKERELEFALHVTGRAEAGSVAIDSAEVRVEQFATELGKVQYRPVIEITYSYSHDDA